MGTRSQPSCPGRTARFTDLFLTSTNIYWSCLGARPGAEVGNAATHCSPGPGGLWMSYCWLGCLIGEGNGTPLLYSCPENPMDGGAWWAAVHGVAKSLTRLSDFAFTFHFHALEKEMATYSSVLAWRIPGTRESRGLCLWGHTESDMTEVT